MRRIEIFLNRIWGEYGDFFKIFFLFDLFPFYEMLFPISKKNYCM